MSLEDRWSARVACEVEADGGIVTEESSEEGAEGLESAPDYDKDPVFWAAIRRRLHEVFAGLAYRSVGEMTSLHPETVRRYMLSGRPSVEFLTAVCEAFEVSVEWLVFGRGAQQRVDAVRDAVERASAGELLREVARRTLERSGPEPVRRMALRRA